MILEALTVTGIIDSLKLISATIGILSFVVGVFKVISWIKNKFTNINDNVVELKNILTENMTGLREDIKSQTAVISSELREQRQDFRTFYAPYIVQMQSQLQRSLEPKPTLAKAKRTVAKKKPKARS